MLCVRYNNYILYHAVIVFIKLRISNIMLCCVFGIFLKYTMQIHKSETWVYYRIYLSRGETHNNTLPSAGRPLSAVPKLALDLRSVGASCKHRKKNVYKAFTNIFY